MREIGTRCTYGEWVESQLEYVIRSEPSPELGTVGFVSGARSWQSDDSRFWAYSAPSTVVEHCGGCEQCRDADRMDPPWGARAIERSGEREIDWIG